MILAEKKLKIEEVYRYGETEASRIHGFPVICKDLLNERKIFKLSTHSFDIYGGPIYLPINNSDTQYSFGFSLEEMSKSNNREKELKKLETFCKEKINSIEKKYNNTPNKIDFTNGIIKGNNKVIYAFTPKELKIVNSIKTFKNKGGIGRDNLRKLTTQTQEALMQSIKELKKKLKNLGINKFIFIEYKEGEDIYNLIGEYCEKVEKK